MDASVPRVGPARVVGEDGLWKAPEPKRFFVAQDAGPEFIYPEDGGDDAGPPIDLNVVSNTPNAQFVGVSDPDHILRVVSSNFMQDTTITPYFREWYAVVENISRKGEVVCLAKVTANFGTSTTTFSTLDAYIQSRPYDVGSSTLSTSCVAPGERAALYTNEFSYEYYDPAAVSTIMFSWSGYVRADAIPHPLAPTLTIAIDALNHTLVGTGDSSDFPVYNLAYRGYVMTPSGLLFDSVGAYHLDTLEPGSQWTLATDSARSDFTDYLWSLDFISGRK